MGILARFLGRGDSSDLAAHGPLYPQVKDAMREVQAYARSHGGNIDLVSVNQEGDVKIRFRGTCVGCPMSSLTLKLGIEERLRILVPGVKRVIQA